MSNLIKISEYEITGLLINKINLSLLRKTYDEPQIFGSKEYHSLNQTIEYHSEEKVFGRKVLISVEVSIDLSVVYNNFNKYVNDITLTYKKRGLSDNFRFDNDKVREYIKEQFEKQLK